MKLVTRSERWFFNPFVLGYLTGLIINTIMTDNPSSPGAAFVACFIVFVIASGISETLNPEIKPVDAPKVDE